MLEDPCYTYLSSLLESVYNWTSKSWTNLLVVETLNALRDSADGLAQQATSKSQAQWKFTSLTACISISHFTETWRERISYSNNSVSVTIKPPPLGFSDRGQGVRDCSQPQHVIYQKETVCLQLPGLLQTQGHQETENRELWLQHPTFTHWLKPLPDGGRAGREVSLCS